MRHPLARGLLAAAALAMAGPASGQVQTASPGPAFQAQFYLGTPDRKPAAFELVRRLILFRARLQDRDVWALLDNGFDRTMIDVNHARSHGMKVRKADGKAVSATGSLPVATVSDVAVLIPGQVRLQGSFAATDLSMISQALGRPVALVVGRELFESMAVAVRISDGTFEFWPSSALALPAGAPRMIVPEGAHALLLTNERPQLEVSVLGRPATVTVDLGSDDILALGEAAWKRLGLDGFATVAGEAMGADGRPVATRTTIVPDIRIGAEPGFGASVTVKPILPGSGDGLLGMGYLSRFDFALDVKARRLWLIAPAPSAQPGSQSQHLE